MGFFTLIAAFFFLPPVNGLLENGPAAFSGTGTNPSLEIGQLRPSPLIPQTNRLFGNSVTTLGLTHSNRGQTRTGQAKALSSLGFRHRLSRQSDPSDSPSFWRKPLFAMGTGFLFISVLLVFLSNIALRLAVQHKTKALQDEIGHSDNARKALAAAHNALEQRVADRTAELQEKNNLLEREVLERTRIQEELAVAREIANCTVHNIGNVINSLVVSVQTLEGMQHRSRVNKLKKALDLIGEHRDNIAEFLSTDPRGSRLLDYLMMIADEIPKEHEHFESELLQMDNHLRLIREMVQTQQNFASSYHEPFQIQDIIEDALKIQFPIERGTVRLVRRFEQVPAVTLDRVKLAHVFLNLIKNAKDAMQHNTEDNAELTIGIRGSERFIEVSVTDNGQGIRPDDLEKLGTYGFTTKADGHGFGLKYCVGTLQNFGAKLVIESDGPKQGATFKVLIPLEIEDVAAGLSQAQSMGN